MAAERHVEVDERWIAEWTVFGFTQLCAFLANHAAFDRYLEEHHRDDPKDPSDAA